MLGIMLQKMWQKKWMNLSILLGCVLFVATAVSFPLYQKASYDRMLQDEFENYILTKGRYPMIVRMAATCQRDKKDTIGKMEDFTGEIYDLLGVKEHMTIKSYAIMKSPVASDIQRDDAQYMNLSLGAKTDLEDHAKLITGRFYSESGLDENGAIEIIVSQATMVEQGLLLDETLEFEKLELPDGGPIRVHVVGVYTGAQADDFYFQDDPERSYDGAMMNPDLFQSMFTGKNAAKYTIAVTFYDLIDYTGVSAEMIEKINEQTDYLTKKSAFKSVLKEPTYKSILEEYALKKIRITATLTILQVPVLILLAAFLLMISGQMYEMERNEISVIKSRGSSRAQILRLYLYQGLTLVGFGALFGIPLGTLFARLLGSTRNFLEFDLKRPVDISFNRMTLIYAVCAMAVALLSISLPAIKHSRVTIVNLKQQKALKKKSLWEKLFLDVILIGISLYGYYSFQKSAGSISETVLSGRSLDPLLYLSSSLFILGAGMFFLRIQPLIVNLIYLCVKRFLGPAGYISFMENMKNGRKMQLIMLFLIMTVSLGIFHATVARTIVENAVENREYLDGSDVVMKENWPMMQDQNGTPTGQYVEPDPLKYLKMDFTDGHTRVYYDDRAYIRKEKNSRTSLTIMAIHTKEFGQMTDLPDNVNPKAYYTYLNELAKDEDGILLSRNFETIQGVKIGDDLSYYNSDGKLINGTVVDFVDYFPSYSPTVTVINADGNADTNENFLIVANYAYLKKVLGLQPYEVWLDMKEDSASDEVYDFMTDHSMRLRKYINKSDDIEKTITDPLLQGTNGILTLGFAVTILLCAVGYLIYWIMSIRERELVFGVLRACGFHKGEVVTMLIGEQVFCGVFSILAGIGIGRLTSWMFVPMLQASYATSDQVLPMRLITNAADLYRLYGIVASVMLVCIVLLIILLFRMNVTKALKLGEE